MESVLWNLRTLNGFVLGGPVVGFVLFVLVMFWDYPLLLACGLARRALGKHRRATPTFAGKPPSVLVVIPTLLRKRDELTSLMRTIESIASNGYPGRLLVVISIDGAADAPDLYSELSAWSREQQFPRLFSLRVTGTNGRRGKPMAVHHATQFVKKLVANRDYPELPPVYVSTDADADLGPDALAHIVSRLQRPNPMTGWPTRVVSGALHVRGNEFWQGWRRFFTIEGQLNLQVAREYYVSNIGRHNIRWLPQSGIPGAFYCTWTALFLELPAFMGYLQTLETRHWLGWWIGAPAPKFSETRAAPIPELIAGDTDDTVTAYVAMIARYQDGVLTLDPPRTPLHALGGMLRGLLFDRAVQYEPLARVFTTSPTTIRSLGRQRKRWNTARVEVTGRVWRALGYHWTLGFTAACMMFFMARSVVFGILAYIAMPFALVHHYLLTGLLIAFACHVFVAGLLTLFALLINDELEYWRLGLAVPLVPVYMFCFNWLPATLGLISDVLLFGNVTGFAPETTLIKGGSTRIALLFRVRRFCLLCVRAIAFGDVPLGKFWFGWRETRWTPSGYEGFTTKKKRSILPPLRGAFRRRVDRVP